MHDCPCCGEEIVYSSDTMELCSCCKVAGCEDVPSGGTAEMQEYECQKPFCSSCGTSFTFCTDRQWHTNCECEGGVHHAVR